MKKLFAISLSDVVFIMLIVVKMPTFVGILTFMSRINFVLSQVEHGKSFITTGSADFLICEQQRRQISLCIRAVWLALLSIALWKI